MNNPVPFLDLRSMHDEIRDELDACWRDVTEANAFVGGAAVDTFEQSWARYCSARFSVGTANGTDSIELALRALKIGPGDEVVVPANTFIATAEAVTAVGATPVFADVDPDSLLLTGETLEAALTARTVAVIVVHLFGHPVDMDDVGSAAAKASIVLVEDAAQAHGATWNDQRIGSFGVAASFSFYPGKNLGAFGDGGAFVTDDGGLAETVRSLANHGRSATSHTEHALDGCNSRLDGLQAAILSIKLERLDRWNKGRSEAAANYRRLLPAAAQLLPERPQAVPVHHLAIVRVAERDRVRAELADAGIGSGVHYPIPCHLQPAFSGFARGRLPHAEKAAGEILSLPMFPHLTEAQISRVAEALSYAMSKGST